MNQNNKYFSLPNLLLVFVSSSLWNSHIISYYDLRIGILQNFLKKQSSKWLLLPLKFINIFFLSILILNKTLVVIRISTASGTFTVDNDCINERHTVLFYTQKNKDWKTIYFLQDNSVLSFLN